MLNSAKLKLDIKVIQMFTMAHCIHMILIMNTGNYLAELITPGENSFTAGIHFSSKETYRHEFSLYDE